MTDKIESLPIFPSDNLRMIKNNNNNILICFNVLNKGYYGESDSLKYLSIFCKSLKNKAFVLIGRNFEDKESSSIYEYAKDKNKLILLKKLNQGWDYERKEIDLVINC